MISELIFPLEFKDMFESIEVQDPSKQEGTMFEINFQIGNPNQILYSLENTGTSGNTIKNKKYPLIALKTPIHESKGDYFNEVKIDRIIIAHLTKTDTGTENVIDKYSVDGVYLKILYPIYDAILEKIANHPYSCVNDKFAIVHDKDDIPSDQVIGQGLDDYVDIIEITNLKILFNKIQNCN